MRHVEERLRRSLTTRADDVRPDPATWARVEASLRRRAWVAWSAAGVTVAAALVLAALVLPGLFEETRVDLSPADPPPPPTTDPEHRPEPTGFLFLATDGEALTVHGPAGPFVLAHAQEGEILDFATHPASTTDDLTVVWREGRGCAATLYHARAVGGARGSEMDTTAPEALPATCPGRPAFAPEGTHLAWMSQPDPGPEEPAGDELALETLAWDDGPAESPVTFAVQAQQPETFAFDVTDWIWTGGDGAATAGMLHLVGYDSHGTPAAHTLAIERQGDGALAMAAGATAQEQPSILQVDSHASDPASGELGPSYALESVPGGDANTLQVVRRAGEGTTELPLPEGLLTVYGGAMETDNVWMTARGNQVLLGDGAGQAWRLAWTDDGWGDLEELDGEIRYAAPVQPAAVEEPPDEGQADAGEDPADPGDPADALPAAVADTRRAVLDAARADDVDALAELAGEDFTSSFGGPEEPRAFFTRLRDEGELDRLVRILELPHGEADGLYTWPFAHTRDLESLSSAELELLGTIATQEEIDGWFAFGGYAGWRAGIGADGTWRFYVAGD